MAQPGKRNEDSLRPLTEKEIQQKLYGSFYQNPSVLSEESERESTTSFRKEKKVFTRPSKRPSFSLPKFSIRFPWRGIFSLIAKLFRFIFGLLKATFSKVATGWGISILVVGLLFAGIYALNIYRADVMKRPAKPSARKIVPRKRVYHEPTPLAVSETSASSVSDESVLKPPTPAVTASPVSAVVPTPAPAAPVVKAEPPVVTKKPYVIQVCTYARKDDADTLVGQMNAANLPAFVQPLERANGKTFYPVFIGRFGTFREAQAKLKEFREKSISRDFPDSFIRAL